MFSIRLTALFLLASFLLPPSVPGQSTEGLQVDENGNVGVGTASPDHLLDLEGESPDNGPGYRMMFVPGKNGAFRAGWVLSDEWGDPTIWNPSNLGTASVGLGQHPEASGGFASVAIGRGPLATGVSAVAIGRSPNATGDNAVAVGHGTISDALEAYTFGLDAKATAEQSMTIGFGVYGEAPKLTNPISESIMLGVEADPKILINAAGVGIEKTDPTTALDVNGTVSATNVEQTSARRFKTGIEPLDNATALVEQLRGVRYQWKEGGEPDVGFVAEEVESVLPSLVSHTEDGKVKGLNYSHLTAVLAEALKQQTRQSDSLQQKLERQQTQLNRQQDQLERQRQQIEALRSVLKQSGIDVETTTSSDSSKRDD
jgi:hypothetical protein